MKKESKSLSEKQFANLKGEIFYPEKDVKEFIKRLKDSTILNVIKKDSPNWYDILIQTINKLAGEKLI